MWKLSATSVRTNHTMKKLSVTSFQHGGVICEPSRPEGPLIISDVQANSVHLSWKPPLEDYGGPILGYVIEAKDVLQMDVRKTYFWSEGQHTEYTVKELETSHIYQFRVYAQNIAGRSEGLLNKSLVRIKAAIKKPPTPSKPTAELRNGDSVFLEWKIESINDEDLNYLIERYEPKYEMWMQCNRDLVTRTSYLVTDLVPNREYRFRISSENIHGVSRPSKECEPVSLKMAECVQPLIRTPLKDCYIKENGRAVFMCEYEGTPPIQVKWTKEGIRVSEGSRSIIKTETNIKSELELYDVDSDDDDAPIQCSLRNAAGETSSEAKIKIQKPPKLKCPASYHEGLTYDSGDVLRIRITTFGKPSPQMEWFFNERIVVGNDKVATTIEPGFFELKIEELSRKNSGNYTFLATNEMGTESLVIPVCVLGPPDPLPNHPVIEWDNEEDLVMSWNPPLYDGGSSVYSYIVEKRTKCHTDWEKFATTRQSFLQLQDSNEVIGCFFRVKAVNVFGISEASTEYQYLTDNTDKNTDTSENIQGASLEHTENLNLDIPETNPNELNSYKLNEKFFSPNVSKPNDTENMDISSEYFEKCNLPYLYAQKTIQPTEDMPLCHNFKDTQPTPINNRHLCSTSQNEVTITDEKIAHHDSTDSIKGSEGNQTNELAHPIITKCQPLILADCFEYISSESIDDATSFRIKDVLQERTIFVTECFQFYTICYINSSLETTEDLIWNDNILSKVKYSWNLIDTYLEEFYQEVVYHSSPLNYSSDICAFQEKTLSEDIDEGIITQSLVLNTESDFETAAEVRFRYLEISFIQEMFYLNVISKPVLFESTAVLLQHASPQQSSLVLYLREPLTTTEIRCFENISRLVLHKYFEQRIRSVFHIEEEFESLATLNPIPFTTYKPALSVLPIIKHSSKLMKKDSMEFDSEVNRFAWFKETRESSRLPRNVRSSEFIPKEEVLPYSAQEIATLKSLQPFIHDFGNERSLKLMERDNFLNSEINNSFIPSSNAFGEKGQKECTFLENYIPNWLPYLSPYSLPPEKSNSEQNAPGFSNFKPEDKIASKGKEKVCLKEKSFEELLLYAEEVEKNFSQKAQQIESLESILHDELDLLEKDLKVVHEIHRSFNYGLRASDVTCLEPMQTNTAHEESKDLIDFSQDVTYSLSEEFEHGHYPPKVITHLQNKVVQRGSRARLYCSITGDPDPDVIWMKNGKLLPEKSRYVFNDLMEFGYYVDIFNVKSSDSGQYACLATNSYGSTQTEAYLQVIGAREDSPEEPKFQSCPDDLTVDEDERVVFEWKISGTPVPNVIWFKNAEKIETSIRIDAFSNYKGTCRLTIHHVIADDSAIYSCYLENEVDSSVSTVLLSVKGKNQMDSCQTKWWNEYSLETEYTFALTSSEKSTLPLQKDTVDMDVDTEYDEPLPIRRHKPKKQSFDNIPGSPCTPSIFSAGKTWVMLSWFPPLSYADRKSSLVYLIERRLLNSNHWKEVGRTTNTLYTAYGFKGRRSYAFRISAGNSHGWSRPAFLPQPVHFSAR